MAIEQAEVVPSHLKEASKLQKHPVVEIFGPTIQGEGIDQGVPCHFVRFGGCDYKCRWCDSPHAVLPNMVRYARRMTALAIVEELERLPRSAQWVVLSGGNPCLHNLRNLVTILHLYDYKVALETQGTRYRGWEIRCDRVCVSPKPPSSGHITDLPLLRSFVGALFESTVFLKIVVLDQADYQFAKKIHALFPRLPMFLSACNDAGATVGNPTRVDERSTEKIALDLIASGRNLANRVMIDPEMSDVRVQIQNHVLYWGNERGR